MIQMEDNAWIGMLLNAWKAKIRLSKESILYVIIMCGFSSCHEYTSDCREF